MLCGVITGPTERDAWMQIAKAADHADLLELRLDLFEDSSFPAIQRLKQFCRLPLIFKATTSNAVLPLLDLKPDYVDLDISMDTQDLHAITQRSQLIVSSHDFHSVPHLETLAKSMRRLRATYHKIAVTPKTGLEALQFLLWAKSQPRNLIPVPMGEDSQWARVVAACLGSPIIYASPDEGSLANTAILSLQTWKHPYRFSEIDENTLLYGLLGNPVSQSISDRTHNAVFGAMHINARYVKIPLTQEQLPLFLEKAKQLPFRGFSVTMPFKEQIDALVDHHDASHLALGTTNTLTLVHERWIGSNTDGIGALEAIQQHMPVAGTKVVVLGAGGAARAIAHALSDAGANLLLFNRSFDRAQRLAQAVGATPFPLSALNALRPSDYDLMINTIPNFVFEPQNLFSAHHHAMDLTTRPKKTPFLALAEQGGARLIYGEEMFVAQAVRQFVSWFPPLRNAQFREAFRHLPQAVTQ